MILTRISHHLTVEVRRKAAITSLRLLAVLNVLSSTSARAKRLASRPDDLVAYFASPRGEKCGLRWLLKSEYDEVSVSVSFIEAVNGLDTLRVSLAR